MTTYDKAPGRGGRAPDDASLGKARPEYSTATTFVDLLTGGGAATYQSFDDSDEKRGALVGTFHGTVAQLIHGHIHGQQFARLNDQGAGVFICLNVTNGLGRKAENITAVRGLVADVDTAQPLATLLAKVQGAGMPPPTLVVESSPEKHHLYWLTHAPGEIPLEEFKPMQQALARACESDPHVCDLPRVMRLPGFLHCKGEPFTVRLVKSDGPRYAAAELEQALAPYREPAAPRTTPSPRTGSPGTGNRYAQRALENAVYTVQGAAQGQRNNTLNREALGVFGLVKGGALDEAEARDALTRAAQASGLKPGEIDPTLASAWRASTPRQVPEPSIPPRSAANDDQGPPPAAPPQGNIDPRPLPLAALAAAPRYPLELLGDLLGEAAERMAWHVQAPAGMAGQSCLATAALVAQAHIDVARGAIGTGPTSLFCLTVAESGERKSTLDRYALRAVREWERSRREAQAHAHAHFTASHKLWHQERQKLEKMYETGNNKQLTDEQKELKTQAMARHDLQEPRPPKRAELTFSEPTEQGVFRHLKEGLGYAGLFSDEGGTFLGGFGMREETRLGMVTQQSLLHDGSPIFRTRGAEGESEVLEGRRQSAHLMLQDVLARQMLGDGLLTGQGYLSRFLVVREPSLVGQRFLAGRDLRRGVEHEPAVGRYWEAITEVLNRPLDVEEKTGALRPRESRIEGAALDAWAAFHDHLEGQLGPDGPLSLVTGFTAKAAENAARIAAILAFFDGELHPSVDHVKRASALMEFYVGSLAAHTHTAHQDQRELEAREILEAIIEKPQLNGTISAQTFKYLPNRYARRNAKEVRALLALLVDAGYLRIAAWNNQQKPSAWCVVQPVE